MAYTLTREDLASITGAETAFGTDRLLPPLEEIPEVFLRGNVYTQFAEALLLDRAIPAGEVTFRDGYANADAQNLNRCVRAHLASFSPDHDHKIAGVGYMIAQVCTIDIAT
ncbi:hypothetical protein [Burkholderia ubonensis]|uniref:hypothetical protein n=1 Tax=Burkholderia ubonensis TaxID=101571 RepID=UPI00075C05B8|nr:hypothetical protein [Burkholderia ubonensis]KVV07503.1 hypothetical protein WK77_16435 [Burkholderia ubonensis]